MSNDVTLDNDYERMVPEFHKGTLTYAEHLTRYMSLEKLVDGKVVLDIASGSGYGTHLLSKKAKLVYGVDVNARAVAYSKKNYSATNLTYLVGDGERIPLDDNSVDIVVTLETIEHIPDYKKFIKEIKRVLKDDGLAVISTPNDLEFAEGNHFHLHEFEYDELVSLLKQDFVEIKSYFQATWKYVSVATDKVMSSEGQIMVPTINMAPIDKNKYLYFFLLCSNREITEEIEPISALGEHYSDRSIMAQNYAQTQQLIALKEQIKQLKKYLKNANQQGLANQKLKDDLSHELIKLKSSKAYKVALSLSSVKNAPTKLRRKGN